MPRKQSSLRGFRGFTLIELLVTVAVLAILLAVAIPNFSAQIQRDRSLAAAEALKRAVAQARSTALQTGRRTQLLFGASNSDCGGTVAWAIVQVRGTETTLVSCLSSADFSKRYSGTSLARVNSAGEAERENLSLTFLPTGVASATDTAYYKLSAGSSHKTVRINAGGSVDVL